MNATINIFGSGVRIPRTYVERLSYSQNKQKISKKSAAESASLRGKTQLDASRRAAWERLAAREDTTRCEPASCLRAPRCAGRRNYMRAGEERRKGCLLEFSRDKNEGEERRKGCLLEFSRDKNEGANRSGQGGEEPAYTHSSPWIWVTAVRLARENENDHCCEDFAREEQSVLTNFRDPKMWRVSTGNPACSVRAKQHGQYRVARAPFTLGFDTEGLIRKVWFGRFDSEGLIRKVWFGRFDSEGLIRKVWFGTQSG